MSGWPLWISATLLGWLGAWWISRTGRLDPLERRRLHVVATPRGGGVGIALAAVLALLGAALYPQPTDPGVHRTDSWLALAGVLAAALAGAWEDRHGLAARWRLLLHLLAAALLIAAVLPSAPWWWQLLLLVGVAGLINLVNFMDGANGLVGLQALVCGLGFAVLGLPLGMPLAGAALGFLPLNFPRARVFLGDVGSYVVGAWIALLCLQFAWPQPDARFALLAWMGLAPLLLDACWTLLTRVLRGRRWYSAHREHLYQWVVRTGWAHWQVSLVYAALAAVLWLLAWYVDLHAHSTTIVWQVALLVSAGLSGIWWYAKFALRRAHRRQLRAARVLRRSSGSSQA